MPALPDTPPDEPPKSPAAPIAQIAAPAPAKRPRAPRQRRIGPAAGLTAEPAPLDVPPETAPSPPGPDADTLASLVSTCLDDDKAEDIVVIDVRGKSSVADVMIVASGRSQRHVGALADHVLGKLKEAGLSRLKVEGMSACDWVLVDAGDVIVHLFRPEVRAFYDIERIWAGARPKAAEG